MIRRRSHFPSMSFEYELPPDLIAQAPPAERDAARLLVVDRGAGRLAHRRVRELPDLLCPGDVLVVNDSRVIPARLRGRTDTGARIEVLLVREREPHTWECLGRPVKRLRPGRRVVLADSIGATVVGASGGRVALRFNTTVPVLDLLDAHGEVPLPPYIRRRPEDRIEDRERYQTVYARVPGAVAAPTAGLHLTEALIERLRGRQVELAAVTLHVGPGTFLPIRKTDVRRHWMEPEWVDIPAATAAAIGRAKRDGRRVVAVGTTTTRGLESRAGSDGAVASGSGWADAFIVPGYRFRVIDGLLTNFHLPRSTLLMLVAALAGWETVLGAYEEAVRQRYRFYSYGDAMLITGAARE